MATTSKQLTVSWTDPNPAGSVTDYLIERSFNGATKVQAGIATALTFTETVTQTGTYRYSVSPRAGSVAGAPTDSNNIVLLSPVANVTVVVV